MARTQVLKNIHPILSFDKVDECQRLHVLPVRKDVETQFGKCDMIDFIDVNGEEVSIFMGAALKLFDWESLNGEVIDLVYKGKIKNPKTKRQYDDFEVYTIDETPEKKK
jgi:hypothetical protein